MKISIKELQVIREDLWSTLDSSQCVAVNQHQVLTMDPSGFDLDADEITTRQKLITRIDSMLKSSTEKINKRQHHSSIKLICKNCGWVEEKKVVFMDIEEDFFGADMETFKCPTCKTVQKSRRHA